MALKTIAPDKETSSRARQSDPPASPLPALHTPLSGLMQLQRSHGNRFVQRFLSTVNASPSSSFSDIESSIQQARGNGQPMDAPLRTQMESAFGMDLSPVRMHIGARADALNQELNAHAFTTGPDIFSAATSTVPAAPAAAN